MNAKKIISILMLLLVIASFCACEETTSSETDSSETTQSKNEESNPDTDKTSKEISDTSSSSDEGKYADEGELKIRIFKMGKSDAYLLRTSSKTILIDGGDVDDAQEIIDYFAEKTLTKIDYLIFTHLDKKSIGASATLIEKLDIGEVYEPSYTKNSTEYLAYSSALSAKNISSNKIISKTVLYVDDISITIYPCEKSYYSDDDNYTNAISISHGENSFLFIGDAKSERISEIVKLENIKHDFLMVPDNGAYDPDTEKLLDAVSPTYAAITCSTKNPASTEVQKLLSNKNINTYLTTNGSIKITSNGSKITVEQ